MATLPRMRSRVDVVEAALDAALEALESPPTRLKIEQPLREGTTLTAGDAVSLWVDQVTSRTLDVVARELKARGEGYYTISSAGHEDNVVLGALLRATDPCFLHYRSGALMLARARYAGHDAAVRDTLLSLVASAEDPIARGRHKVWGSRPLWVPPQTSTIASHLPKAVGTAFAIDRAARLGVPTQVPPDSIVCCSFGDASANHATALAGINAARYARRRGSGVPVLFVCEDNGIGISVETPKRWIETTFSALPQLTYIRAEGELEDVWDATATAVRTCRERRTPVFLHLRTVRLWGHAGSDVESGYRSIEEIERDEAADPLVRHARRLVATGAATPAVLRAALAETRRDVRVVADQVAGRPKLETRDAVVAPLAPGRPSRWRAAAAATPSGEQRSVAHPAGLPEVSAVPTRRTMAAHLNSALRDELAHRPGMLVFGEDVGRKGGVYHVTAGLQETFGAGRVFDTLLDETTILGIAQGAGLMGLLPVPEIQYLAYVHNALDQLRGEACSLSFFSSGQFTNPMVVRVAGLAYQKGFGGHFHNDNSVGALRDIPGLAIAVPARGDDAARLLRGALAMAAVDGRVVVLLEPIALYHEKDLHAPGDGGWLSDYPKPGEALLPGDVGVWHGAHSDVLLVSYANGLRMSLRVAAALERDHGMRARVLDLRWLAPLPLEAVREHARACAAVLVVDECRATAGGVADTLVADLAESGAATRVASVRAADSYVPLGPAADTVLLSESDILRAALRLRG